MKDKQQKIESENSEVGKASIQNTIDESTQQEIDDEGNLNKEEEEERSQRLIEERQKVASQLADIGKVLSTAEEQLLWIDLQKDNFEVQLQHLQSQKERIVKINLSQDVIRPEFKGSLTDLEEEVTQKMK